MTPILIGLIVFIVASLIAIVVTRKNRATGPARATIKEALPHITDDEFMALCTPGTSREVALKVRQIVAHSLAVRYEQVWPSTRFIEDLGAD